MNSLNTDSFIKDINRSIISCIEMLINKKIEKLVYTDRQGIITGVQTTRTGKQTYKVSIDGAEYAVYDGINLQPEINSRVWVHLPNGSLKDAYICAKA